MSGMLKLSLLVLLAVACVALATPVARPGEGSQFTNEAIRQAQNTYLIPKGSSIQKVQEAVEVGARENIPGDQKINLFEILGDQVPVEVINNLQSQIDQVGRQ